MDSKDYRLPAPVLGRILLKPLKYGTSLVNKKSKQRKVSHLLFENETNTEDEDIKKIKGNTNGKKAKPTNINTSQLK